MDYQALAVDIASRFVPPPNGRQDSRITEVDTVQQLLEAVADGNYMETSAELAGLSKVTVYAWLKRAETGEEPYKTLANAMKRASARAEAVEVAKVRKAGEDPRFWAASMTYLERRHPEKWGRRQEGQDSPKVIVQIGVKDSDVTVSLIQPTFASDVSTLSEDMHRLNGDVASDKGELC